MVTAVAYTAEQLRSRITALETSLDRHERTVQFADRSVTYNSFAEMHSRIQYFRNLLARADGRPKQTLAVASKGL